MNDGDEILNLTTLNRLRDFLSENYDFTSGDSKLIQFRDTMFDFYEGCSCDREDNLTLARKLYISISKDQEIIESIKKQFGYHQVNFYKKS
jgi:hypothetical protein